MGREISDYTSTIWPTQRCEHILRWLAYNDYQITTSHW